MRKGSHMSEESKKKISISMIEVRKTINPMKGRTGERHHNFGKSMSEEQKKKLSDAHKGKPSNRKGTHHTEETKRKISESKKGTVAWNKGLKTGPHTKEHNLHIAEGVIDHPCGRGQWYISKNNKKIWLRSSYEVRVADILDNLNFNWSYETERFEIGNKFYVPDFYINNSVLWEVKGYMDDISKEKLSTFSKLYPNEKIRIIYLDDIKKLEYFYANNIKFNAEDQGIDIKHIIQDIQE